MARNKEKAQSMLYRFREVQAAELGIGRPRSDQRRPRLASSVQDLRECERWRADVLKEISRKVSKIQDFGLNDYEVRDLNDEINKLLREKGHWERQIVAVGGANYSRGVTGMLDDAGKEVPGTRGYKYFGRAKDLPGVKELLTRSTSQAEQAEQAGYRASRYRRFANQPPSYLGDEDEDDGVLLAEEEEREREAWQEAILDVASRLGNPETEMSASTAAALLGVPSELPRRQAQPLRSILAQQQLSSGSGSSNGASRSEATVTLTAVPTEPMETDDQPGADGKRKTRTKAKDSVVTGAEGSGTREGQEGTEAKHKRSKVAADGENVTTASPEDDRLLAQLLPALDPTQMTTPRVPDRAETEAFILRERKRMLREEYSIATTAST